MKYVYVLVSNEKDKYLEQLYLSLISFNMRMNNEKPLVIVDNITYSGLVGKRRKIFDYADVFSVDLPQNLNNKQKSRWLKTTIPNYVQEDFLFIDCDTIICDDLSEIKKFEKGILTVPDSHVTIDKYKYKHRIQKFDKKLGFSSSFKLPFHMNSGVIFYHESEENRAFFNKWHNLWKYTNENGISSDQTAFNEANLQMNNCLLELPGIWNCQITENGLKFLAEAKIIHYFSSTLQFYKSPYVFADYKIYDGILDSDILNKEIVYLMEHPKSAFYSEARILADPCQLKTIDSKITKLLYRVYKYI